MRWFGLAVVMATTTLGACGGGSDGIVIPTVDELYGDWRGTADDGSRMFHFAGADDGTHAELAGMHDVYLLANDTGIVQTGHFSIEKRLVTGYGTTDALVTAPASGTSTGMTFGNAILAYDDEELTISSTTQSSGKLTLTRQ